jgi:predicted TIM-barrel fold metal-dependent hydrolase
MIIDVHTHILKPGFSPKWMDMPQNARGLSRDQLERLRKMNSPEEHFKDMEPVDKAIVFGGPEEFTAEYARRHPDKIIGFASVDPLERGAARYVRYCVKELGLKGLKMYPIIMHFFPNDEKAYPVYETAQELEVPVLFHMGANPSRESHLKYTMPIHLMDVAKDFPDLTMIIAHMGHPYMRDTVQVMRIEPNIYADVSGMTMPLRAYNVLYQGLLEAMTWGVLDKLLFGTDWPFRTFEEDAETLRNVNKFVEGTNLPKIPEDAIEGIIEGNAERAFKNTIALK